MKLNSTMKHRRIHIRLLISMLTVALRFSYSLISKDSVFNAMTYNLWSTTDYTITENVDYEAYSSGNSNLAPKYLQTKLRLEFDFNGYYDGKYYAIFTAWPSNTYYTIVSSVNCQISYYSTINYAYEITFNGVQHCEIVVEITNFNSNNNGALPPVFPRLDYSNSFFTGLTKICSSPTYLVERINSKLSDLKDNTDGIEGALSTIANSMTSVNTNLVTINSTLIDMYNRQNVTNGKLDTINTSIVNGMNTITQLLTYDGQAQHNIPRTLENISSHTQGSEEYLRQIKNIVQDLNPTQQTNIDTEINTYNNLSGQVDTIINNNITTAIGNFPSINDAVNNFIANNLSTMNKVRNAVTSIMPTELNTMFGTYFMLMAFGLLIVVMLG